MTADSVSDLRHRDRIDVVRETDDGEREELTVFNWVTLSNPKRFRGYNPTMETFDPQIGAGDTQMAPDAVTKWGADEIQSEEHIDVRDHGIEVIDIEDDDIDVYY